MRRALVTLGLFAVVGGCAPAPLPSAAPPTPALTANPSNRPSASGAAPSASATPSSPAESPSTAPAVPTVPASETAYVALEPVTLAIKDGVGAYRTPDALPTFGADAQPAAGFTLLPVCQPADAFSLKLDTPEGPVGWDDLTTNATYAYGAWPAVEQLPHCDAGTSAGYLQVSYNQVAPGADVGVTVTSSAVPETITVVPVFTSSESGIPWMASLETVSHPGAKHPANLSATKVNPLFSTQVDSASWYQLPDGSHPDHLSYRLTGCSDAKAPHAKSQMTVLVTVGASSPAEIGTCGGGISVSDVDLPFPTSGQAKVVVTSKGGSTGFGLRVSMFIWRAPGQGS